MTIGLIWAQARDGLIGRDGVMPWYLPEDLAHFRAVTGTGTVIMGRRTWDSLPERFRPLPGRENIVLTRQAGWKADGARSVKSLDSAFEAAGDSADQLGPAPIWVIGGGQIYAAALEYADVLEVTEIDDTVDGDTHAPKIPTEWQVVALDPAEGWHTSKSGERYRFLTYSRSGI